MISPELQETAIREHCARNGYDLEMLEPDLDLSGRFWKRRKIGDAIARVESGDAEVIVVWKISRVARNRLDWNVAVDRVEAAGGRLESATEPIDATTSSGRFSRGVLAELAAFESERIGEGWRETHARRWRNGLPADGRPRFGYQRVGRNYVPDPDIAPIVRGLYERYVSGETFLSLTRWLEPMNLGTLRSNRALTAYMDSGFAAGWLTHHAPDCAVKHQTHTRCPNLVRDRGAHEPIVPPELWDEYQNARRKRVAVPARLQSPRTAFAGIIFCTECGYRYSHHRDATTGRSAYRCDNGYCGHVARSRIEQAVLAWLPTVAAEVNAAAASAPRGESTAAVERSRLERIVLDADRALSNLTVDRARRIVPEDAYEAARDALTIERDAAQARVLELDTGRDRAMERATQAADLLSDWDDLTELERNRILANLCVVYVTPNKGRPQLKTWARWEAPPLTRRSRKTT